MPFCPDCKTEFQDGYKTCNDCGTELVDKLQEPENIDFGEAVFLSSIGDEIEADMLVEELESNGITVLKKFKETGAFMDIYMGMNRYGIDLYVPSKQLDEAKKLMENLDIKGTVAADDKELAEENKELNKKRAIRAWIILLFLVPGVLSGAGFLIITLINR